MSLLKKGIVSNEVQIIFLLMKKIFSITSPIIVLELLALFLLFTSSGNDTLAEQAVNINKRNVSEEIVVLIDKSERGEATDQDIQKFFSELTEEEYIEVGVTLLKNVAYDSNHIDENVLQQVRQFDHQLFTEAQRQFHKPFNELESGEGEILMEYMKKEYPELYYFDTKEFRKMMTGEEESQPEPVLDANTGMWIVEE